MPRLGQSMRRYHYAAPVKAERVRIRSGGIAVKTKLLDVVAALALFATANSAVQAATTTYTYSLNGTLAEDSGSGPSLVAYGGTLTSSGYYFGPNMGLSLSNAINPNAYSIDMHFYFDNVSASWDGYQRILDFKNRTLDMGLYSQDGQLNCFRCGGYGPAALDFASGQFADLRLTRSAGGLFNAYINGALALSVLDSDSNTTFSGPDNIIYFFMDDFQSLGFYPDTPEAGSGRVTFIEVTSDLTPTPLPAALPMFATGLGALGLLGWRRKRKQAA